LANTTLFRSLMGALIPKADAINEAGGPAYSLSPEQALAQFASTGCLNTTFYATDAVQLDRVTTLAERVSTAFVAKTAVYCRERGYMKDMPALLLATLSRREPALMDRIFDRVVDSPRVLRTFVQIVRSGATGRKSLGSAPKRCVRRWLDQRTDAAIFAASVGNDPSLVDVVRMVHPKPATPVREALYAYLMGRTIATDRLPPIVREFEAYKTGDRTQVPDVPFQMLTSLELDTNAWCDIARRASWQATRMNLNTFARHGVFARRELVDIVAARLRDESEIRRARVFPYQLLAAYRSVDDAVPSELRRALEDAMETAIANVPSIDGQVYVCPDVSGSMRSPITGARRGATTTMRCVDVAALVSAAVLRRNPDAEVLQFDDGVRRAVGSSRRRWYTCQRAAGAAQLAQGKRRSRHRRVRQRVVGGRVHGSRHGDDARVEQVPRAESARAPRVDRSTAVLDDAGVRAIGHPERRRVLGSGVRYRGRFRRGALERRSLGR
jgi:60 kDa SS-A/Ro ribonucleoprotein